MSLLISSETDFSLEKQPYCDPTPTTAKQWEWIFSVSQTFFWPGNPNTCTFYLSTVLTPMFIREEGVYYSFQGTIGKSSLWLFKVTYTEWVLIRHCWFTLLCISVCVCVCVCTRAHMCTCACMHTQLLSCGHSFWLWSGIPIVGLLSLPVQVWFHLAESTNYTPEPEDNDLTIGIPLWEDFNKHNYLRKPVYSEEISF